MISGGINDDRQQTAAADEEQAAAAARSHHAAVVASSSRQWSAQTESRIVRVSRVFGGKDRHSKVKTVKGLRDRLSVPTAIQLYDLQDRLGLNQPSKVVDWLLNAARHEIDKLPPLQFPPHQQDLMVSHHHHLPPSQMIPLAVHEEKFGGHFAAALAASERAKKAEADAADGSGPAAQHLGRLIPGGYHRFMGLNNSLGMVNSGATMAYSNHSYAGGEAWNNNSNVHHDSGAGSPHVAAAAAAQHSSFPSLLSLAPGPHHHQLVFYSSEADQQFQQELGSQGLSLSSVRAFHDQTGS